MNVQENVWGFVHQNYLAGQIFSADADIVDACCHAWKRVSNETSRVSSFASRDWLLTGQKL